jgi:hypothetical protein
MMFIKHYNLLKGVERYKIATFAMYQKTNIAMLTSTTWKGSLALDWSISSEKFESFRHWMMSMTSLVDKPKKDPEPSVRIDYFSVSTDPMTDRKHNSISTVQMLLKLIM